MRTPPIVLAFVAGFALAAPARSAEVSWSAPAGGSYENAGNWLGPVAPPGVGDTAVFDLAATYTVTLNGDAESANFRVSDGDVVFDLNGSTYRTGSLGVGAYPLAPRLTLVNGTFETTQPGLCGDCASTDIEGGPGTLLRVGAMGRLLTERVGIASGSGEFEVVEGGEVLSREGKIGQIDSNGARAIIDGPGSRWTVSELLTIAEDTDGYLEVRNGGHLETGDASLALWSDFGGSSEALVTGAGSLWANQRDLTVAGVNSADLKIEAGASVSTRNLFAGRSAHELGPSEAPGGRIALTGSGTLLQVDEQLVLGGDLGGTDYDFEHAPPPGTFGYLTVTDEARAVVGQRLLLWNGSRVELAGGSLDVGSLTPSAPFGTLRVHEGGVLGGVGTVAGTVRLEGELDPGGWDGASGIEPALGDLGYSLPPARLLTIEGDLVAEEAATLTFDLVGSPNAGMGEDHDAVAVSGEAILSGVLAVSVAPEALALIEATDVFTLLTSDDLSGAFLNVASGGTLAIEGGLGTFSVFYGAGSLFDETAVVLTNFMPVPEPSTLLLLAAGTGALALLRKPAHRRS